jgi:hypothetical protein
MTLQEKFEKILLIENQNKETAEDIALYNSAIIRGKGKISSTSASVKDVQDLLDLIYSVKQNEKQLKSNNEEILYLKKNIYGQLSLLPISNVLIQVDEIIYKISTQEVTRQNIFHNYEEFDYGTISYSPIS